MISSIPGNRLKEAELIQRLHQSRETPEIQGFLHLLELQLEEVKDKCLTYPLDSLLDLQGQAKILRALIKFITQGPVGPGKTAERI